MALKNTQQLLHGVISPIEDVLNNNKNNNNAITRNEFFTFTTRDTDILMYTASNQQGIYGANIMLYEECLKLFAERMGYDFYILPSSIHEVLFVPETKYLNSKYLLQTVRSINSTVVAPDQILSDMIYYYHLHSDSIEVIRP